MSHQIQRSGLVGVVGLALLLAACSSQGGTSRASGLVGQAGGGSAGAARFFMPTGEPTNTAAPSVEVDAQGAVHAVYPQYVGSGAFYAHCPAICSGPDAMKVVRLETDGTVHNAMLALSADGTPHVLLASARAVVYATPGAATLATDPASWSTVEVLRHEGTREVTGEAFALDPLGRPRFVMHAYKAYLGVGQKAPAAYWVACDSDDCGKNADAWSASKIADQMWRSSTLRYDASGVARLGTAATVDVTPSSSGVVKAVYAECARDCGDEGNWHGIALLPAFENEFEAVRVPPVVSLALTKDGSPRIAFLGVTEFGKKNITYFSCDADCTSDAWRGTVLSDDPALGAGLDLALDANDRPRFVHTKSYSIGIASCDASDCAGETAPWTFSVVEDSGTMKPDQVYLYDNCIVSAWFLHSPSLALSPDGRPRIGYQARDISSGFGNPDPVRLRDCVAGTDMTWSRLAVLPSVK